MTTKRPALGKGLSALIGPGKTPETRTPAHAHESREHAGRGRTVMELGIERITPNRYQARKSFDAGALSELASSIARSGMLQPLVVRAVKGEPGKFELIAGERRFRAAPLAGLKTVPAIVIDASDMDASILSMVENIQREDLNPIDEAEGLQAMMDNFELTQQQVSEYVGKNRSTVANLLRLLSLPEIVKTGLAAGKITEGHARALLGFTDADEIVIAYNQVVSHGLSVRETERLAAKGGLKKRTAPRGTGGKPDPNLAAYLRGLSERFGTKVTLAGDAAKGKVEIHYFTPEDRERILDLLDRLKR